MAAPFVVKQRSNSSGARLKLPCQFCNDRTSLMKNIYHPASLELLVAKFGDERNESTWE